MMWGGVLDWRPEAKVKIAQATKEISGRLAVDEETANRLWERDEWRLRAHASLLRLIAPDPASLSGCCSRWRSWGCSYSQTRGA
jgi:hypothetical protein